jgi:MerR family transcriptional regulator, thiopeptide resistance regulator
MDTKDMFNGFDQFDPSKYEDEARERWGHTDAYKESARRTRNYSKADFARIKAEGDALIDRMADVMRAGRKAEDSEAVEIAEAMRLQIDRWFYPCDRAMHDNLGEIYVSDARFAAAYESRAEGLAEFVAAAIKANARR